MASNYQNIRSEIPDAIPSAGAILEGEIAVNLTDRKIFSKTSGGTVVEMSPGSGDLITLVDGASIPIVAGKGRQKFYLSTAVSRTLDAPSGGIDGQQITIFVKNTSAGTITITLPLTAGGFRFGSDITALSDIAAGKTDYLTAILHPDDGFWDVVGNSRGF